ncbi:interferon alpha/beta receptor 2 isoform X3 [Dromaius novaehollandiae]|uniref:Tissue factor n=2 Tax=Dromaius novaehollandiae TaxID=8790 RepID=A0A8C4PC13_DRONO|nr:interferon alpha/beta receptor 2 isoform X2 [Dromaius novaehollandiae]
MYNSMYISILSTACYSLRERSVRGPPLNLQMKSHNFQHTLSWQAGNDPTVPTHYRVLYTDRRNWMTAKQCSDIMQLLCNLTEDFKDVFIQYSTLVQSFIGTEVFNSSALNFMPFTDTLLGPPEVNVSSCPNCINITVKLPTSHFRKNEKLLSLIDIYEELDYEITLKTHDGQHKRPRERTTREIFNTVIEDLYPNRNYCVSVTVSASLNKHSISSPWKCVTADSVAQQDYRIATITGAVCFSLTIIVIISCMYAGGFILQNKSLPRTLVFIRTLAYSPFTFEPEKITSVEIISKEVKKKAKECSGNGSDEDDDDSVSDARSNHDYTRRDIFSRVPHSSDTSNAFVQCCKDSTCEDSSSQASQNPGSDLEDFEENEVDIEEDKGASMELLNPFSEVNCTSSGSRSSACFTINLQTVLLGTSEENVDSSAALLSSQEDKVDWLDSGAFGSKLLDDTGSVQKPLCHNISHEWENSSSSDESDSSDSDMDQKTEYIRR